MSEDVCVRVHVCVCRCTVCGGGDRTEGCVASDCTSSAPHDAPCVCRALDYLYALKLSNKYLKRYFWGNKYENIFIKNFAEGPFFVS